MDKSAELLPPLEAIMLAVFRADIFRLGRYNAVYRMPRHIHYHRGPYSPTWALMGPIWFIIAQSGPVCAHMDHMGPSGGVYFSAPYFQIVT